MFRRGRGDTLIFIARNQGPKRFKDSEEEGKTGEIVCGDDAGRGENVAAVLVREVSRLRSQQLRLQAKLKASNVAADAEDLHFQRMIASAYNRYCGFLLSEDSELEHKMAYFVLFMFDQYINQDSEGAPPLESVFVNNMNESLRAWSGSGEKGFCPYPVSTKYFFAAFNLKCRMLTPEAREYIGSISREFLEWVVEFTRDNGIVFPSVDYFFIKLIYCTLRVAGLTSSCPRREECPDLLQIDCVIDKLFSNPERKAICDSLESSAVRQCCPPSPTPRCGANTVLL